MAPSTPSTTWTARIASRYSVRQSASVAGSNPGSIARTSGSPRSSQPAARRSARIAGSCVLAVRSTSSVSVAPQIETRRILALSTILRAFSASAAAPQDGAVAGVERPAAGVCLDVRPALLNEADHAKRHRGALGAEPVRARPFGKDTADRIGQRGNGFQSGGNRLDAFRIERQPIVQRGGEALRSGLSEVAGIGREDVRFAASEGRR